MLQSSFINSCMLSLRMCCFQYKILNLLWILIKFYHCCIHSSDFMFFPPEPTRHVSMFFCLLFLGSNPQFPALTSKWNMNTSQPLNITKQKIDQKHQKAEIRLFGSRGWQYLPLLTLCILSSKPRTVLLNHLFCVMEYHNFTNFNILSTLSLQNLSEILWSEQ